MKKCTKCKEYKPATTKYFTKLSSKSDKLRAQCNECKLKDQREKRNSNRKEYNKRRNQYLAQNKDKRDKWNKRAKAKRKDKIKEEQQLYAKNRRKLDINFRLAGNLRSRLNKAIKNNYKTGSAVSDLGCSIEQLKKHLELQFTEGMSWNNYGDWHIDHIQPLANFDLTDEKELKKACHYTNLQPMWAKDNIIKSNN